MENGKGSDIIARRHGVIVLTGAVVDQEWGGGVCLVCLRKKANEEQICKPWVWRVSLSEAKVGVLETSYNDNTPNCHLPSAIGHFLFGQPY